MTDDPASAKVALDEVEPRDPEWIEPTLLSVGYELRPGEMRPNVRRFDAGESTTTTATSPGRNCTWSWRDAST